MASTQVTSNFKQFKRMQNEATYLKKKRTHQPPRKTRLRGYVTLILLTLAAFCPMFLSDVIWSPYDTVERSAYTSLENWQEAWHPENLRRYDPISTTTYFIEQALPLPLAPLHYGINLVLHLTAAILLLRLLQRLKLNGAWITSLVFALHPATLQTLFWSGYRSEFVGLIAILMALHFGTRTLNSSHYIKLLLITIAACIIHPGAFVIPFILMLYTYWQKPKFELRHINYVLPILCICLFVALWKAGAVTNSSSIISLDSFKITSQNLYFYLKQAFSPIDGWLFYTVDPATIYSSSTAIYLLPLLLFAPIFFLSFSNRRKSWARGTLLGALGYLLLLIPGLINHGAFIDGSLAYEDHGQYIALPALVALVFCGAATITRHFAAGARKTCFTGLTVLIALEFMTTVSFAAYAVSQPVQMWQQFSKQWPNSSLAKIAYFETLRADAPDSLSNKELIQHLEVILEMDSNNLKMRTLYARTLRERREYSNAYREYRRILQEAEPNVDFLKEAVEFYEQIGKQWEANKLRDQIDSLPQHEQTKFQNSTN